MKPAITQPPVPNGFDLIRGSIIFGIKAASTLPTLIKEVSRTAFQTIRHADMNADQRSLLQQNPTKIAVLIPGFQLDGSSLSEIKKAFNNRNIPALFPEGFPFGLEAVLFRDHPNILVEKIVDYVARLQKQYPESEIILFGHSFGGTEGLHAARHLKNQQIIPVTLSGLLEPVGVMAYAAHSIYYRHASHIFAGDDADGFILQAQRFQLGDVQQGEPNPALKDTLTIVNSGDGYLPLSTQAGAFSDNFGSSHVIMPDGKTPRHYVQGRNQIFSRDVVGLVLERIATKESTQQ